MSDEELAEDEKQIDPKKLAKLDREKKELLASLSGGDFSKQKTKVAHILNLYPESRNSDITLTLKYWETFQSDIYSPHGILPKDLFRLERMHYIVRARAKIQNEYGLFTPNTEVKRFRRKHEEEMSEAVLEDAKPRKLVHVYADETGKTQNFVVVSSVWVLTGSESPRVPRRLHYLREWSHDQIKQVFPRGSRACGATGARASGRVSIALGGR